MARSVVIVVSDDQEIVQKAKNFAYTMGLTLEIYSISQWEEKKREGQPTVQSLIAGSNQVANNVIQFPQSAVNKKVKTIDELESVAIENAIHEYRGNLTEAARALGIGRATLYRKVKQYKIDPSLARRKKVA